MPAKGLLLLSLFLVGGPATAEPPAHNLLLNPEFRFHCFANSRTGQAAAWSSGSIPCWNQDAYGDVEVCRATRTDALRPEFPIEAVVRLKPGKRLCQFALLAELGLDHGDRVSLSVRGKQAEPDSLQVAVHLMQLDSQSGEWTPLFDRRTFPKHSRGELVRGRSYTAMSGKDERFRATIAGGEIVGAFTEGPDKSTDQPNTIGLEIELVNRSAERDVWLYAPCLVRGATPQERLPEARALPEDYRGIPRTLQKLWRGEPLHIIVMGSSIDRGSANPPMCLYDEDPQSPTFKQPKSGREFSGELVGHPEWDDYVGWWQHYFMYGGRLRRLLMEKFDYPIDKLLLNTMACDGSSISESHSGLLEYAELRVPPEEGANGHRKGKTWQELYPAVFARPEGPRPDLVIFGSGANEKVDGADEIAIFEGAIRWFQRHYPGVEFLFCMWQNREGYTPNTGHLMELALRYQVPYLDLARALSLTTRYCNSYALCPRDGHPQAAGHYLWAKQIERAFDAADPIRPGVAQLRLPERVHPATLGWEGEMVTYPADHPRVYGGKALILDDTAVNLWATVKDGLVSVRIDGQEHRGSRRKPSSRRDMRNSTFATGLLTLGDRHVLEVTGNEPRLIAADCKLAFSRKWLPVGGGPWQSGGLVASAFVSKWGSPFGNQQLVIPAGKNVVVEATGTLFSVVYADRAEGGKLTVEVDGEKAWEQATNQPFVTADEQSRYLENRKATPRYAYGKHSLKFIAAEGPVALLGIVAYDTRE